MNKRIFTMCGNFGIVFLVFLVISLRETSGLATVSLSSDEVLLKEVSYGETVVLKCRSKDMNHNFEYWLVESRDAIIGPANENYDKTRYNYEILTGNLIIRGVSKAEEGIYSCVSRAVAGNNIRVDKIKMMLKQNWEDSDAHESHMNTIKILIVLIILALLGIGGYVIFRLWRNQIKYSTFSAQDEDEESNEEIFQSPTTSGMSRSRSPGRIVLDNNKYSDNLTDFESFLDTANDK